MKKLDDIPKKNPFSVPDGYFEKLPGVIQSRIAEGTVEKQSRPYFRYALQFALPGVVLAVVAILYLTPKATENYNDILATVSTELLLLTWRIVISLPMTFWKHPGWMKRVPKPLKPKYTSTALI